jgi:hypothetical protein
MRRTTAPGGRFREWSTLRAERDSIIRGEERIHRRLFVWRAGASYPDWLRQRAISRNHLTTPGSWRQASSGRFFFSPSMLIVEEASYLGWRKLISLPHINAPNRG